MQSQDKMDRLQNQLRRFQNDLEGTQTTLLEKIKTLESVQVVQNSDLHQQLKQLTDQLNSERTTNTKLNQDLAKSLEVGLQLQLEIQNLKTRNQQIQNDERKFNQSLQDKIRSLNHDLELSRALREEVETELDKTHTKYASDLEAWNTERTTWQTKVTHLENEIQTLHLDMENMEGTFEGLQTSSEKQSEAFKHLTQIAENKIVELKIALDRKTAECRDYEGHLQQALTQNQLFKQENLGLKDHITKMNAYLQSSTSGAAGSEVRVGPNSPT